MAVESFEVDLSHYAGVWSGEIFRRSGDLRELIGQTGAYGSRTEAIREATDYARGWETAETVVLDLGKKPPAGSLIGGMGI